MLTSQQNVANSSGLGVCCDDFDRIFVFDNRGQNEKKGGAKDRSQADTFANANFRLPTIEKNNC